MLLTEEQAKTKWCPFVRLSGQPNTFNRADPMEHLYCIASACMAWRWAGYRPVPSQNVPNQNEAHGYCGLAGDNV